MIDIKQAEQKLLALKAEYQERIEKIEHHFKHPEQDMTQDWDDQAVVAEQNEMRKSLLVEAQHSLELVNAALRRIENGTYGIDIETGEEIDPKRLEIIPYATTNVKR
ncbi:MULTISPECIES: TraR/DksA family transcriptional regulator [unclassified Moraxella]|uniref:TraR/DksA family transcriptional regulator n=1 Tax=unclassified Moraxella TaxID=2685852 RepID=UPI003AF8B3DD